MYEQMFSFKGLARATLSFPYNITFRTNAKVTARASRILSAVFEELAPGCCSSQPIGYRSSFSLLLQPRVQRLEVLLQRLNTHLFRACYLFKGFWPWLALPQSEHVTTINHKCVFISEESMKYWTQVKRPTFVATRLRKKWIGKRS